MAKTSTTIDQCPMEIGIDILSGKWKIQIIYYIYKNDKIRFNELQRLLGNITTKTLTNQLRELERDKIIKRHVFPEIPPHVEYSFTEIGKSLKPVMNSLCQWGKDYQHAVDLHKKIE